MIPYSFHVKDKGVLFTVIGNKILQLIFCGNNIHCSPLIVEGPVRKELDRAPQVNGVD
jgi:hypothetical protein